jgi:hypothetical protein
MNRRHWSGTFGTMRATWFAVVGVSALTIVWLSTGDSVGQGGPNTDVIARAWRDREGKASGVKFELKMQRTLHKNASNHYREAAGAVVDRTLGPNPSSDVVAEGTGTVAIQGDKFRYAYRLPKWDSDARRLYDQKVDEVFDGQKNTSFRDPGSLTEDYSTAVISRQKKTPFGNQFSVYPIVITLRGHHPGFYNDLAKYEPTGRSIEVRKVRCIELVFASRSSNQREQLLLDPRRDYVVVRKATLVDEQPTWQIDIEYAADPKVGWVPSRWEYFIKSGQPKVMVESGVTTVDKYSIADSLPDSEFTLAMPVGTRILDRTGDKSMESVVQPDGATGEAVASSQNPTYEDLKDRPRRWRPGTIALASGVVCLAILTMMLVIRRIRRQATPDAAK